MRWSISSNVISMLIDQVCVFVALRSPNGKREAGQCLRAVHLSEPHEGVQVGAHMQTPSRARMYIRNKRDLTRPRRRATCGKVSPSPELCCSRRKGVTRSGRAAHRSPHYLGEALLNIQNAPNAEEARHAHVQRCRRRCEPMREDEKRGHATRASRMRR